MHVKRTVTIVLGAGAVAAWLAGAATSNRALPDPVPAARASIDARGTDLENEIAKLRERLRPSETPRAPGRNLFAFRALSAQAAASAAPRAALTEAPPPARPALPPLKLSGLSEDQVDGAVARMAFISADGQLFMVKEGEQVTPRYRVTRIFADGVELLDLTDNTTRQLGLR